MYGFDDFKRGVGNIIKNPKDAIVGGGIGGLVAGPIGGVVGGILGKDKLVDDLKGAAGGLGDAVGLGDSDVSGIDRAQGEQRTFADELRKRYGDQTPREVPRVGMPTSPTVQTIGPIKVAPTPGVPTPNSVHSTQVGPGNQVVPGRVSVPQMGPAGQTQVSTTSHVGVNRGVTDALSPQFGSALGLMRGAAEGTAPSVAQGQMRQGLDEAIAAQMGAAAAARGRNIGLAQRGAMMQGARMQQKAVNDSAMLRASEMAQAREAYANSLLKGREQDIGIATTDSVQANTVGMDNSRQTNTVGVANTQERGIQTRAQGEMEFEGSRFDREQELDAGKFNVETRIKDADRELDAGKFSEELRVKAGTDAARLLQEGAFKQSDIDLAIEGKNKQFINDLALEMTKLGVTVDAANAKNILESRGLDDGRAATLAQMIADAYGRDMNAEVIKLNAAGADKNRRLGFAGGIIGGASELGAAYVKANTGGGA